MKQKTKKPKLKKKIDFEEFEIDFDFNMTFEKMCKKYGRTPNQFFKWLMTVYVPTDFQRTNDELNDENTALKSKNWKIEQENDELRKLKTIDGFSCPKCGCEGMKAKFFLRDREEIKELIRQVNAESNKPVTEKTQ